MYGLLMLLNMKSKPIVCKSCIEHYEQIINSKENVKALNKIKYNVDKMIYIKSRYDVSEFTRMYCGECQEEGLWVGLDSNENGEFINKGLVLDLALYLSDISIPELRKIGHITTKENVPFLLLENNNSYSLKKIEQIGGKLL